MEKKQERRKKTIAEWLLGIFIILLLAVFVTGVIGGLMYLFDYFTSTAEAAEIEQKEFYWCHAGANPFGNRNAERAIVAFDLPQEVKTEFVKLISEGEEEVYLMKRGQIFQEMVFGYYKIVKKVNCLLPEKPEKDLMARIYPSVQCGGWKYFLIRPVACNNWAWWREKVNEPPPKLLVPLSFLIIRHYNMPIAGKEELKEEEEPQIVVVPEEKRFYENETNFWVGGPTTWKAVFMGGNHNSFFWEQQIPIGKLQEGIGITANGWQGKSDGDSFKGSMITIGPVMRMKSRRYSSVSTQVGIQNEGAEDIPILCFNLSYWEKKFGFWINANRRMDYSKKKDFGIGGRYYLLKNAGILLELSDSNFGYSQRAIGVFATRKEVGPFKEVGIALKRGYDNERRLGTSVTMNVAL